MYSLFGLVLVSIFVVPQSAHGFAARPAPEAQARSGVEELQASSGAEELQGNWTEHHRTPTSIHYQDPQNQSRRKAVFGLSLVNEKTEGNCTWKQESEVPLEFIARDTSGAVSRFTDPAEFLEVVTAVPEQTWGFGIRGFFGIEGFFVDRTAASAQGQYITYPRTSYGGMLPITQPLAMTYVRLWAKVGPQWHRSFLTDQTLFTNPATDPRRNIYAVRESEGDTWFLEVGYKLTGVAIQGNSFDYSLGLRVYRNNTQNVHYKAQITCTSRSFEGVGIEYVFVENPTYRETDWGFTQMGVYTDEETRRVPFQEFIDVTTAVPDYVNGFRIYSRKNNYAPVGFDFRDLRKAGLEHTVFRIEQVTLPQGRTAWAGRTGMYHENGWAVNEPLDIDPTWTFYSGHYDQDGTMKYNHDTDTYVYWDDDDWELKVEHDGAYKWAWVICFEVHLIGATTVTNTDFKVQINYENLGSDDYNKIKCFNTRVKVGRHGDDEWDEGDEIYEHDNDGDYWGDSVTTDKFRSEGVKTVPLGSTGNAWFNSYWLSGGFSGYMTFWVREWKYENDNKAKCYSRESYGVYDPRLEVEYSVDSTIRCNTLIDDCYQLIDDEPYYEPMCTTVSPACDPPYDYYEGNMCGCDNGDPRVQKYYNYSAYGGAAAYIESLGYCNSYYGGLSSDEYDYTYSINGDCRYQVNVDDEMGPNYNFISHNDGPEPNSQPAYWCNGNPAVLIYPTCPRDAVKYWHEHTP